jgi:hypothetical protein
MVETRERCYGLISEDQIPIRTIHPDRSGSLLADTMLRSNGAGIFVGKDSVDFCSNKLDHVTQAFLSKNFFLADVTPSLTDPQVGQLFVHHHAVNPSYAALHLLPSTASLCLTFHSATVSISLSSRFTSLLLRTAPTFRISKVRRKSGTRATARQRGPQEAF